MDSLEILKWRRCVACGSSILVTFNFSNFNGRICLLNFQLISQSLLDYRSSYLINLSTKRVSNARKLIENHARFDYFIAKFLINISHLKS